jgi:hypothetical protein
MYMGVPTTMAARAARFCLALSLIAAPGSLVLTAQVQPEANFADLIKTPDAIQRTLEHCDGDPAFETALSNWLETAEPASPADRQAIHTTALRLLEDTADRQLVLGLTDGLLRHALADMKRDRAVVPENLARALYAEIARAARSRRFKTIAIVEPAYSLSADVNDGKQAAFLKEFLNLAEARAARLIQPSQPTARAARVQGDDKTAAVR